MKSRKIIYWKSKCFDDADIYSVRERTKKVAHLVRTGIIDEDDVPANKDTKSYSRIVKTRIKYDTILGLVKSITGEGGAQMAEEYFEDGEWHYGFLLGREEDK